jgi:hypothetical protein
MHYCDLLSPYRNHLRKKISVSTPPLEKIQNIASIMVYTVRKNTAPSSVLNIEVHVVGGIEKGWPNKSRIYHN